MVCCSLHTSLWPLPFDTLASRNNNKDNFDLRMLSSAHRFLRKTLHVTLLVFEFRITLNLSKHEQVMVVVLFPNHIVVH